MSPKLPIMDRLLRSAEYAETARDHLFEAIMALNVPAIRGLCENDAARHLTGDQFNKIVATGRVPIVELLLRSGYRPHPFCWGIHDAIIQRNHQMVWLLMSYGVQFPMIQEIIATFAIKDIALGQESNFTGEIQEFYTQTRNTLVGVLPTDCLKT